MEREMRDGETVLFVENLISPSSISQCRICHEEEIESSMSLEAPCACSGTVKFAHRACIQTWCNEKGNTTCEICLQKFEPGYTIPLKNSQVDDVTLTIRASLEVPRQNQELHNRRVMAIVALDDGIIESECSPEVERSENCFRSVGLTFSIFLLVRNLVYVLTSGTDHYAFTLLTIFILRTVGILLPVYIMVRTFAAIQNNLQQWYHHHESDSHNNSPFQDDDEENELQNPTV